MDSRIGHGLATDPWSSDWLSAQLRCRTDGGSLAKGYYNQNYYGDSYKNRPGYIHRVIHMSGLAKIESAEENRVVQELLGEVSIVTILVTCYRHDRGQGGLDRAAGLPQQ